MERAAQVNGTHATSAYVELAPTNKAVCAFAEPRFMANGDQKSVTTSGLAAMGLATLGVGFGDIGTSPLYTLKTVIDLAGGNPSPSVVLGVVSLIFWTLVVITTIKYVTIAMRIDNDGEGGIL